MDVLYLKLNDVMCNPSLHTIQVRQFGSKCNITQNISDTLKEELNLAF